MYTVDTHKIPTMTAQQALDLIKKVTAEYHGTRQDHKYLSEAEEKLQELVNDNQSD